MIDQLSQLLAAYIEWRTAAPDVYMSLGPLAIGLITTAAGFGLNKLFGGPSGSEQAAFNTQSDVARSESELIRKRIQVIERLMQLSKNPSAMGGILEATGGQGFQLPRDLASARERSDQLPGILESINFDEMNERDLLLSVLGGTGSGSSATNTAAALASRNVSDRDAAFGDIASLIGSLLAGRSSPAPSLPFPSLPPGATGVPGSLFPIINVPTGGG